jgi:hypothetical protein
MLIYPHEKGPWFNFNEGGGALCAQQPMWIRYTRERNSFWLSGIEPRTLKYPFHSPVTVATELSCTKVRYLSKKRLQVTFTLQINLADHGYVLAHTYTCHTYLFA